MPEWSAAAPIISALATLVIALGIPLSVRRILKMERTLQEIVAIVRQQAIDAERYSLSLQATLKRHGIEVPVDQSQPVIGKPDAAPGQSTQPYREP